MNDSSLMKTKACFPLKQFLLKDSRPYHKIIVCSLVFFSVFSFRLVVAGQRQFDFSLAMTVSEANLSKSVSGAVVVDSIDINAAQLVELKTLPGIGPKLADSIIKSREKHGPFLKASDLLRVKGIGSKRLEKILPHLRLAPLEVN
jgi:competence protein ComEA